MNLSRYVPCIALAMLGFVPLTQAHADTYSASGNFTADNSVFTYDFTATSSQTYTIATTSYAAGGFDPVLTLFSASGAPIDNFGSGASDATLTDTLASGSYVLDLTEFPNVAVGTLSQGFLFASDPTATGDVCGVAGGTFLDSSAAPCVQRSSSYALTVNSMAAGSTSVTPEPSTWLLVLSGAVGVFYFSRRQRIA